jgi:hypothetical protein
MIFLLCLTELCKCCSAGELFYVFKCITGYDEQEFDNLAGFIRCGIVRLCLCRAAALFGPDGADV